MILNLRGTSGSGKTTVARSFLREGEGEEQVDLAFHNIPAPTKRDPTRRMDMRIFGTVASGGEVCLLGSYDNNCGGCDGFSWKGVHDWLEIAILNAEKQFKHVVFEGLIISGSYKRYRDLAGRCQQNTHWMILNTPFEECLRRIHSRSGREVTDRMRYNAMSKWKPISELSDYMSCDPAVPDKLKWSTHEDTEEATRFARELLGV